MTDLRDDGTGTGTVRALLETVLDQMPGSVILAEAPSGRVLFENHQVAKIWRDPPGDRAPREGFHPDGSPYRHEEWPLNRTIATGEVVEGEEIEIRRGDGTRGVVLVSASPVRDAGGAMVAAVATMYDVTEQKRGEAARHFLAEAGSVLSSSLDTPTTLRNLARLAVPTLADWCGVDVIGPGGRLERLAVEHVDPERVALARELAERFPPSDAASAVHRAMDTGEPLLFSEITDEDLVAAARSEEHLALLRALGFRSGMVVPLIARGSALGAISLFASESGRRFTQQDLALAQEFAGRAALAVDNARLYDEATAANRAKSDFLAVVSHELRTPLTAIIGYTELMELGIPEPLTPRQKEQVQRVEIAAQHLLQLIEEILTMVSIEAGREKVRPAPILLSELLHRVEVIIAPLAAEKKLELVVAPLDEDVQMEIDPDKAVQMLLNLLSNAVKFTSQGSVELRARRVGEKVEVAVRDTGMGVEPEYLEQIFEPFWQVEQPATRRAGGSGLGLAVSRRLAELLGGEVRVESEPGKGSTFTATLPVRSSVVGRQSSVDRGPTTDD
jgi:signal transduction histidine kinase